ncbi:MAG: polysaccharide biosynthesis protein [Anaerolineales bacterium]|nr:polysaccharide biosynthesis protein [Anaerolineales bacterium]
MKTPIQIRNRIILLGDIVLIITSVLASFALRLDLGRTFMLFMSQAWTMVVVALIIKPLVYYLFGLYRRYWAYASVRELRLIAVATIAAEVLVALMIMLGILIGALPNFPRSVLGIDWLLSLFSVGGIRIVVRILAETGQVTQKTRGFGKLQRVIVVGAGDAGALVVREMQRNPQLNMIPVAFVDDDTEKLDKQIHGIPVAGKLIELAAVWRRYAAKKVVIAIPTAPGPIVRLVSDICRHNEIPFQTMPGIYELIGGRVSVSRLREVNIDDLLRREIAHLEDEAVGDLITGRRVLITGGGGSIGLELCRQVARWRPTEIAVLGHGENSIFEGIIELHESFPEQPFIPVIADVRDSDRLYSVFQTFKPQVVFHAAAHKHVPLMELNVEEAITNNVQGTMNVVEAALAHDTERFVFISTDKAVEPTSVYGATKRMAEIIVRDAAERSGRKFVIVRFGNVLGSRGSIVPTFKRQIARGGPVTITHPEMKRFFMTIPEAVHLVLQAASIGTGGDLFVLKMGEQIRIQDLAEDLIRLSGLRPGDDIDIIYTGIRPGEKLSERLWDEGIRYQPTTHPDIVRVEDDINLSGPQLEATVGELIRLAHEADPDTIIGLLARVVPGCLIRENPPPDFTSVI